MSPLQSGMADCCGRENWASCIIAVALMNLQAPRSDKHVAMSCHGQEYDYMEEVHVIYIFLELPITCTVCPQCLACE